MTQRKRLAVARFWYEGNAFCLQPAGREDFERREWLRGQAGLDAARGKATELAAVADFQDSRSDWGPRFALRLGPAGRAVPQPFFRHTWTRCWTIYAASIGTPST
ncbi:M81 family metallopeptidase [Achromobacter xylosoxidans]